MNKLPIEVARIILKEINDNLIEKEESCISGSWDFPVFGNSKFYYSKEKLRRISERDIIRRGFLENLKEELESNWEYEVIINKENGIIVSPRPNIIDM